MKKPVILLLVAALAGCAYAEVDHSILDDEAAYAAAHPYYAEICALSGIKKKSGFGAEISGGGPGGHSTLYLNNVCRDDSQGYPVVKLCDAATPPDQRGVGISVNDHFSNANWVAVPGRDFFYRGLLPAGAPLTRQSYAATQNYAPQLHILDGVTFHDRFMRDRPANWSVTDWQYELSVGTDYATDFARNRYCVRVPLVADQLQTIVAYLNAENLPYRQGQIFHWNVARNNCTHLIHNALATAGVWPFWETDRALLIAAFDFPVPANDLVNLLNRIDAPDLRDLDALYADPILRATFLRDDWLPPQPGTLVEAALVVQPNEVYDSDTSMIFYDVPKVGSYTADFDRFFASPRYTDARANLTYYDGLYAMIELTRQPVTAWATAQTAAGPEFHEFYDRYYQYIAAQRRLVAQGLASYP